MSANLHKMVQKRAENCLMEMRFVFSNPQHLVSIREGHHQRVYIYLSEEEKKSFFLDHLLFPRTLCLLENGASVGQHMI